MNEPNATPSPLDTMRDRLGLNVTGWRASAPDAPEDADRLSALVRDGASAIGEFAVLLDARDGMTTETLTRLSAGATKLAEYSTRLANLTKGTH